MCYLVSDRVLADKDEEDEAAPEKVETANNSEDDLSVGGTLHVAVISMDHMMYTLHYPGNTHHNEQLSEQELEKYFHLFLLCCHQHPAFSTNTSWTHNIQIYQVQEIFTHHINPDQNSCYNKLGCASVKLLVWLEFFKVL